jgi:putative membrane protein
MFDLMTYAPAMIDGPMGGWGVGFWWPFVLFRLLFWIAILSFLAFFAVRILSRGRGPGWRGPRWYGPGRPEAPEDSAEKILRERFARGDISPEEYESSMKTMRETPPRKDYEDYVREAQEQLRSERDEDS